MVLCDTAYDPKEFLTILFFAGRTCSGSFYAYKALKEFTILVNTGNKSAIIFAPLRSAFRLAAGKVSVFFI
jgi:hypothetical protein